MVTNAQVMTALAAMEKNVARIDASMTIIAAGVAKSVQPTAPVIPAPVVEKPLWSSNWLTSPTDGGWVVQQKALGRATLVAGRDGRKALRLHTEPGDIDVASSGVMERNDAYLAKPGTEEPLVFGEGEEQWWACTTEFPDDYVAPVANSKYSFTFGIVFDFHNSAPGPWQANLQIEVVTLSQNPGDPMRDPFPPVLRFRGYGGVNSGDGEFKETIGPVVKNTPYNFVLHAKWSSGPDGFLDGWVNGKKKLSHQGPTLYRGQGVYLKLANYRTPDGKASSVIHDRVILGKTWQSVSQQPLEGVT